MVFDLFTRLLNFFYIFSTVFVIYFLGIVTIIIGSACHLLGSFWLLQLEILDAIVLSLLYSGLFRCTLVYPLPLRFLAIDIIVYLVSTVVVISVDTAGTVTID